MAASTITRATWTNDTGTAANPNADGTILNNTRLQDDVYAKIDEMFAGAGAYVTFTLGGKIAADGFGSHTFSAGGTGANQIVLTNTTAGTGNFARMQVKADGATDLVVLDQYSSTYTPSGSALASGAVLGASGVGGLSLQALHASGEIRFYAGGSTNWFTVGTTGLLTNVGFGSHVFSAGGTGNNSLTVGNTSAGTANTAFFGANNDVGLTGYLQVFSSTYTTSGPNVANAALLGAGRAGGISIAATDAAGDIRFYTGGNTLRGTMFDTGGFSWGDTTDPGATNVRVAGTISLAVGSVSA